MTGSPATTPSARATRCDTDTLGCRDGRHRRDVGAGRRGPRRGRARRAAGRRPWGIRGRSCRGLHRPLGDDERPVGRPGRREVAAASARRRARGSRSARARRGSPRAGAPRARGPARGAAGWSSPRWPGRARPCSAAARRGRRAPRGRQRSTRPDRTGPDPRVIARCTSRRCEASSTAASPASDAGARSGSSPAANRLVTSSAMRWAKTRPSSSELDASRLAPCTPVHEHSPQA